MLTFQYHGISPEIQDIRSNFNLLFTLLFTIECIFKLVSFGPRVSLISHDFPVRDNYCTYLRIELGSHLQKKNPICF